MHGRAQAGWQLLVSCRTCKKSALTLELSSPQPSRSAASASWSRLPGALLSVRLVQRSNARLPLGPCQHMRLAGCAACGEHRRSVAQHIQAHGIDGVRWPQGVFLNALRRALGHRMHVLRLTSAVAPAVTTADSATPSDASCPAAAHAPRICGSPPPARTACSCPAHVASCACRHSTELRGGCSRLGC